MFYTELCRRIRESAENRDFRLVRAPAMTEQPEPYHGEVVHTQEVDGSSPFAPTKTKGTTHGWRLFVLRCVWREPLRVLRKGKRKKGKRSKEQNLDGVRGRRTPRVTFAPTKIKRHHQQVVPFDFIPSSEPHNISN